MRHDEVLVGTLMEETWLTLAQASAACAVDEAWLLQHIEDGLFPNAQGTAGVWRFSASAVLRARRMRQLERDFDAVPELAALVADLLEEIDDLRRSVRRA